MMKSEFEKIAGYEVTDRDYYNVIEPMYMATALTKEEFVKIIDKKRFALKTQKQLINAMKKIAKHLYETCDHFTDYDSEHALQALVEEYGNRFSKVYCFTETTEKSYTTCCYPYRLVTTSGLIRLA